MTSTTDARDDDYEDDDQDVSFSAGLYHAHNAAAAAATHSLHTPSKNATGRL